MAVIIDGKKVSQEIKDEVKEKVAALKEKGIEVTLAVIQVVIGEYSVGNESEQMFVCLLFFIGYVLLDTQN